MTSLKYRPEIDGLRGFAVLLVVIYHLEFLFKDNPILQSGWLGVDLFFVISGYLITRQILSQVQSGSFRLTSFFERRFRRILPPLLFTLTLSSLLAWFFLMPSDLLKFSMEAVSSALIYSNLYFWMQEGYASLIHQKSLLIHTWSLSVEEQFYIFFPLLFLIPKIKRHPSYSELFLLLLIGSLTLNYAFNDSHPSARFFLTPFRFWEFLAGSLVASFEWENGKHTQSKYSSFLTALGLQLMVFSLFSGSPYGSLPGQVLIISGATLFLMFAKETGIIGSLFTTKSLRQVGLISYSLYLIHMPLIQVAKVQGLFQQVSMKLAVMAASLLMAWMMWKWVEQKSRNLKNDFRWVIAASLAMYGLMLAANMHFTATEGAKYRVSHLLLDMTENLKITDHAGQQVAENPGLDINGQTVSHCINRDPMDPCVFGDGQVIVIGDSYLGQLEKPLIEELKKKNIGVTSLITAACPYFTAELNVKAARHCNRVNQRRKQYLDQLKGPRTIIVFSNYEMFYAIQFTNEVLDRFPKAREVAIESYKNNILSLANQGHKVFYLWNYPHPKIDSIQTAFNSARYNFVSGDQKFDEFYLRDSAFDEINHHNETLKLDKVQNVTQIDLKPTFCNKQKRCLAVSTDGPLYGNDNHLSVIGAKKVVDEILQKLGL